MNESIFKALILTLVIIYPLIVYSIAPIVLFPPSTIELQAGWKDDQFKTWHDWDLAYLGVSNANISSENGVLTISVNGKVPKGAIVAAQRKIGLDFDPSLYPYLKVYIRTSSIDVAARIVLWTDPKHAYTVLLKTYNDREWHTEIIDLRYFGITSKLYMVELSFFQLSDGVNSSVSYRELSFNRMVRKP
jgi:hypothetical protein